MKILILADIDDPSWQHRHGEADLIISLGDTCDNLIQEAAQAHGAPPVFAVKGNHDAGGKFPEGITDLHLNRVEFGGYSFGGFNGAWQYKPRGHFLYEQDQAAALLAGFPPVDIFIAHNSPRRVHDKDDGIHYGFDAFNTYITDKQPRLFLHGHQHVNRETIVGDTRVFGMYGHRMLEIE